MEHSKKTRFASDGKPYQIVGALDRAAAFVIDGIANVVLSFAIAALLWTVQFGFSMELSEADKNRLAIQLAVTFPLTGFLYFLGCWVAFSRTLGLKMIGGVIVDETTQRKPKLWQFIVRYLGYYMFLLPYYLGYLAFAWALIDERKQAMHDKFARTLTIRYEKQRHNQALQPTSAAAQRTQLS